MQCVEVPEQPKGGKGKKQVKPTKAARKRFNLNTIRKRQKGIGESGVWPQYEPCDCHARGLFHNNNKDFLVWVNEEDHTRVIAMEKGGNMKRVFERFARGLGEVEKTIKNAGHSYMWNKHLGYILTCPSNLGTGLRAGVHVKLPLLSKDMKRFDALLDAQRLQKRGTGGVDTEATGGTFDISNSDRLGFSEVEMVQQVIDGVDNMIKMEKALEKKQNIDSMVNKILQNKK